MTPDMARDQSRRAAAEFNNGLHQTGRGQHQAVDPLFAAFDNLSLIAAICTAFVFPFLGVIPNRLVLAVNNALATVLTGEIERA